MWFVHFAVYVILRLGTHGGVYSFTRKDVKVLFLSYLARVTNHVFCCALDSCGAVGVEVLCPTVGDAGVREITVVQFLEGPGCC